VSKLHRIRYSEVWHHYMGDALVVVELTAEGEQRTVLGSRVTEGQQLQHVVPGNRWFGAELEASAGHTATSGYSTFTPGGAYTAALGQHGYALVGCTVAPGFDFQDFTMGARDELLSAFPSHAETVKRLT
jgi:predicted cupin superfamily sugar epimerase